MHQGAEELEGTSKMEEKQPKGKDQEDEVIEPKSSDELEKKKESIGRKGEKQVRMKRKTLLHKLLNQFFYVMAAFMCGLAYTIPGVTLLDLQELMNTDEAAVGMIYLSRSIGIIAGGIFSALLLDITIKQMKKMKGKKVVFLKRIFSLSLNKVMALGSLLNAIGVYFGPVVSSLWVSCVVFFFVGIGMQTIITGAQVCTEANWKEGKVKSAFFSFVSFSFGVAATFSPFLCGIIYDFSLPYRWNLLIINGFVVFPAVLPCFVLFVDSPDVPSQKKEDKMGKEKEILVDGKVQVKKMKLLDRMKLGFTKGFERIRWLRWTYILLGSILFFFSLGLSSALSTNLFLFATKAGMSKSLASYFLSAYFIVFTMGRGSVILVVLLMNPAIMFLICISVTTLLLVLLIFFSTNVLAIWIIVCCLGFFIGPFYVGALYSGTLWGIKDFSAIENGVHLFGSTLGYIFGYIGNSVMALVGQNYFIYLCLMCITIVWILFIFQIGVGILFKCKYGKKKTKQTEKS